MKKITYILIAIAFLGGVVWLIMSPGKPGQYDTFAQCLGEKGAKFYGAFWCPHCQKQKSMFGKSAKLLPYTECSTPDGKSQLPVCKELGITTYPTWYFASSTSSNPDIVTGTIELNELSERTSCPLPVVATE